MHLLTVSLRGAINERLVTSAPRYECLIMRTFTLFVSVMSEQHWSCDVSWCHRELRAGRVNILCEYSIMMFVSRLTLCVQVGLYLVHKDDAASRIISIRFSLMRLIIFK